MSDIPRYRPVANDKYGITDDADGKLCEYRDYARLQADVQNLRQQAVHEVSQLGEQSAEIANLKAENEELHKDYEALADEHTKLIDRNARLKAEVERLYRNGDLMLKFAAANMPYPPYATMAKDWLSAKEGKSV